MITDHELLGGFFKKDVDSLSHIKQMQRILQYINQYRMGILYKPGPLLFITDWLSRQSHKTNRDKEIAGMCIAINTI